MFMALVGSSLRHFPWLARVNEPGVVSIRQGDGVFLLGRSVVRKLVLKIDVGDKIESVSRLANGRTVAAAIGWIRIYDKSGKKLEQFTADRATSVEFN